MQRLVIIDVSLYSAAIIIISARESKRRPILSLNRYISEKVSKHYYNNTHYSHKQDCFCAMIHVVVYTAPFVVK